MSRHKKKLPTPPEGSRIVSTYWVTRNSVDGALAAKCDLWNTKPTRVQHRYRVTWVGDDPAMPGHLGEFRPDEIAAWWRVYPETDREIICIETHPSKADLENQRKNQALMSSR